jgi:hypothetical protein
MVKERIEMGDPGKYVSKDPKTGMLEDIEEVRQETLLLAGLLEAFLQEPMVKMLLPSEVLMKAASVVVVSKSLVKFMSQAQGNRELGLLLGLDPRITEMVIHQFAISETLPLTNETMSDNYMAMFPKPTQPAEPPVVLSNELDKFLKSFGEEDEDTVPD